MTSFIIGLLPIVLAVSLSFGTSPPTLSEFTAWFISIVSPLAAIVFGHIARSGIKRSSGAIRGSALSIVGLVLGYGWLILLVHVVHDRLSRQNFSPCIANLKQIEGAVQMWAFANKKMSSDIVSRKDIVDYLLNGVMPECSSGGTYGVTVVSNTPTCTVPGHTL